MCNVRPIDRGTAYLFPPSVGLSAANVEHCAAAKIEPLIAMQRKRHHAPLVRALC